MNAAETLSALIVQADANRRVVDGRPYFISSAVAETSIGRVVCFRDYSRCNPNSIDKHVASNFKLDGKVISRANLLAALAK